MHVLAPIRGRRLSPELARIDQCLSAWAAWAHEGLPSWPRRTPLDRVRKEGFAGAAQRGPTPEMPDPVLAVERAVLKLKPIERRVIVKHYTHWEPIEVSARACDMSANRFRVLLHRARMRLLTLMDA